MRSTVGRPLVRIQPGIPKEAHPVWGVLFCLCDRLILRIAFVIIKKNAKRWKIYDTNYTL